MSMTDPTSALFHRVEVWPFVETLAKMGLAVAIGTLVGLEREHNGKAGVRTFALTALLGSMGGMLGDVYGALAMFFVAIFIGLMNWREMIKVKKLALTTSVALTVVGFAGIMCGMGHFLTPVAAAVITAGFLSMKEPISGFAGRISDKEIRAAILLAVLACIIYPILPVQAVDRWGLIEPRENWVAVIAIAAIGFVNYILLKLLGPKGMEITAFFGGLVNSRKVIIELLERTRAAGAGLAKAARKGVVLATGAMLLRNALIVTLFAVTAMERCAVPFAVMLIVCAVLWWRQSKIADSGPPPTIPLESPFKLTAALKFGVVFLALNVAGALANRYLGAASFYVVSVLGGLLSSASSITSAASLIANHQVSVETGANGVILSSITSVLANIPFVRAMAADQSLRRASVRSLILVAAAGLLGAGIMLGAEQWFRG